MDDLTKEARFSAWMTEFGDDVLRTCLCYLGDRALAEDATQDAFLKVWRKMDGFARRGGASPKTWITRIAINTCKDYRRMPWRRHVDLAHALEALPPASTPADEEERLLTLDVMRLPDRYKQPILLYYVHDMTMEEIAQALHISRASVSARLQKAYALLRADGKERTR